MEELDHLLQQLDRAAQAAEALKTDIAANDERGIMVERMELAKAILAINGIYRAIVKELP